MVASSVKISSKLVTPTRLIPREDFLISDLCDLLEKYLKSKQVSEVYRAYLFGAEAHKDQKRLTGEPYINHPLAVAKILAEMYMDEKSITAAILHDVIEDTPTAKEQIEREFGEEVADLVDGVSKLTQVKFESYAEAQAENFRKMMLAMVRDIRVILVKLADRLHNMRTLGVMPLDKRRRIARETLEIYAPIAHRLGMNNIRLELEDLGFSTLYPLRYRVLEEAVKKARGNRKEILQKVENSIKERFHQEGMQGRVLGREKHQYSIYRKMKSKGLPFKEVFDVYAFRIIVDTVGTCYRVLGALHNLYKPVPGKFKDYIAIPKTNGYQSLHTVLFGPFGVPIEMQIRSEDMNKVAEVGIAAHWQYKIGDQSDAAQDASHQWLRGLLELQKSAGNSLEFLENVKVDLFPDVVYVFTPKGEIKELPRHSTAVDFAFAVHTDVGNSCVAAKIDRTLMPLRTELLNGQTVEIITAAGARPNPLWLDFVITGKAQASIRHYLKNLRREESVDLGKRMLNKALSTFNTSLDEISIHRIDQLMKVFNFVTLDDLLEDIGLGNRIALLVARQLGVDDDPNAPIMPLNQKKRRPRALKSMLSKYVPSLFKGATERSMPLMITGTEGMVVSFAKCCRPIPGDPVLGFITAGRGIVVHTDICKNVFEFRKRPDKWVEIQWAPTTKGDFQVEIRVECINQRGVLATVASIVSDMGSNIDNVRMEERDGRHSTMMLIIEVQNRQHLARVMRRLRSSEIVARLNRMKS